MKPLHTKLSKDKTDTKDHQTVGILQSSKHKALFYTDQWLVTY